MESNVLLFFTSSHQAIERLQGLLFSPLRKDSRSIRNMSRGQGSQENSA